MVAFDSEASFSIHKHVIFVLKMSFFQKKGQFLSEFSIKLNIFETSLT